MKSSDVKKEKNEIDLWRKLYSWFQLMKLS
jgi:hypothetical protein